jgi:hypothetical protein
MLSRVFKVNCQEVGLEIISREDDRTICTAVELWIEMKMLFFIRKDAKFCKNSSILKKIAKCENERFSFNPKYTVEL